MDIWNYAIDGWTSGADAVDKARSPGDWPPPARLREGFVGVVRGARAEDTWARNRGGSAADIHSGRRQCPRERGHRGLEGYWGLSHLRSDCLTAITAHELAGVRGWVWGGC